MAMHVMRKTLVCIEAGQCLDDRMNPLDLFPLQHQVHFAARLVEGAVTAVADPACAMWLHVVNLQGPRLKILTAPVDINPDWMWPMNTQTSEA